MEPDVAQILADIPTLDNDQLDNIGNIFMEMHQQYRNEFGPDDKKTKDASTILTALTAEIAKRDARSSYVKVPDTYNEFMALALSGDRIDGLAKEDCQ